MGVRQALNENRTVSTVLASLLIVVGAVFAFRSGCASGDGLGSSADLQQFFSTDDGKTWFPDDASKVPPFQHDGKPAYRATVYRCPVDNKEFVAYLERYNDADRQRMESGSSKGPGIPVASPAEHLQMIQAIEVKKPGDAKWVKPSPEMGGQYQKARQPRCPVNPDHSVELVLPK